MRFGGYPPTREGYERYLKEVVFPPRKNAPVGSERYRQEDIDRCLRGYDANQDILSNIDSNGKPKGI